MPESAAKPVAQRGNYSRGITNAARGEGEIFLGGKVRRIRFELEQMCELEEALGDKNVVVMIQEKRFGLRVMSEALAVGMRPFNRGITAQQVRQWLQEEFRSEDSRNFGKITVTVQAAIMCSVAGPTTHRAIEKQWSSGEVDEALGAVTDGDEEEGDAPVRVVDAAPLDAGLQKANG